MATPTVVAEVKSYYVKPDTAGDTVDEWQNTLISQLPAIYNALMTKIPDEQTFKKVIAETSHLVWQDFVNPAWEEADFIKLKHKIKLLKSYPQWKSGVDAAFGQGSPEAAYFDERVRDKVQKFASGILYTLGATGLRYLFKRGPAVKAIGVISGMKRIVNDIADNEWIVRGVVNVFLPGAARFVRPQAIAIMTQGMVLAFYAEEAGETDLRDSVISATNSVLQNTVLKQVDTSKYSVVLEIGYDDGGIFAHSKAEQVA